MTRQIKAFHKQTGFSGLTAAGVGALILGVIVIGGYFNAVSSKKELQTLAQKQIDSFSTLEQNFKKIINTYKEDGNEPLEKNSANEYDSEDNSGVLGLEESPAITSARALIELFKDGQTAADSIKNVNKDVKGKLINPLLKLSVKKEAPLDESDKFADQIKQTLSYMEKATNIEIKATSAGFDIGVALNSAITTLDNESIDKLEAKIKDLQSLADEEKAIDINSVPEGLREDFQKNLKTSEEILASFDKLPDLIRNRDAAGITAAIESLSTDSTVEGEKALVTLMSFWQNDPSIRAVSDLKGKWDSFKNQF